MVATIMDMDMDMVSTGTGNRKHKRKHKHIEEYPLQEGEGQISVEPLIISIT